MITVRKIREEVQNMLLLKYNIKNAIQEIDFIDI